ncbi:MAG: LemA family protein [Lentisphaerae bacterium]|nr:LemA family protein [Lentisphaerota bacterium]
MSSLSALRRFIRLSLSASLVAASLVSSGCGYNRIQSTDEQVSAAWSEVLNQYQRRADLVPNMVNIVKGYAAHEKELFMKVTEARARVGSIQATPGLLNDQQAFDRFVSAQNELRGSLSRLIAVAENYPQVKADGAFRDLQAQIEGTENRIAVARNRYIEAVRQYNVTVRSFPANMTAKMFNYTTKPTFSPAVEEAPAKPPTIEF